MDRPDSSSSTAPLPSLARPAVIAQAVERLLGNGFIGYPTETVWGLGACADRPRAMDRLFEWKGRSTNQPMSVLVGSISGAAGLGCHLDQHAERLARRFWPGPLTLVVPSKHSFAMGVARADGALGLRCSGHPVASALVAAIAEAGLGPITSTSMNRSGRPPAEDLASAQALVVGAGAVADAFDWPLLVWTRASGVKRDAGAAQPSSVVDCTGAIPKILRAGAIDAALLERAWSEAPT